MKALLYTLLMVIAVSCIKPIQEKKSIRELKGNYLGQILPTDTALIYAEGIVSNQFNVRDAAFAPDGNEFFYSIRGAAIHSIISLKRVNGVWTQPEVASFSGKYSDIEPCFSENGNKLYFVSNRPIDGIGEPKDFDIWFVEREKNEWTKPKNIGLPINTTANEFYPSFTNNGDLYFCANYENGIGGEDLYFSEFKENTFQNPINLGDSINSVRDEFNSFVSPDGSYIVFTSMGWGPGFGGGDLWISFRKAKNKWTKPKNMGDQINSSYFEYCPSITPDGKYFFFTSNRSGGESYSKTLLTYDKIISELHSTINGSQNIYWTSTDFINELNK